MIALMIMKGLLAEGSQLRDQLVAVAIVTGRRHGFAFNELLIVLVVAASIPDM